MGALTRREVAVLSHSVINLQARRPPRQERDLLASWRRQPTRCTTSERVLEVVWRMSRSPWTVQRGQGVPMRRTRFPVRWKAPCPGSTGGVGQHDQHQISAQPSPKSSKPS